MQRSTISLIVEELVEGSWVIEGPTGRLPRGRRPTYLRLNEERAIIGVDIRPVQTTIALADVNGRFTSQEVMATPADPKAALDEMIQRIRRLVRSCKGKKIEGVGISVPGRYDRATDRLVFAPNLKWRDVDLRTAMARATDLEIEVENAANAC
ncbi:MAG TPA: ROK family protein, partial [Bryobacteraceae bacterium]|nr:ROK family protein [Bryobacteraceae bacterium]